MKKEVFLFGDKAESAGGVMNTVVKAVINGGD